MPTKVTVLGAGNAGYALSAHLGMQGHEVCLFEHPDFKQALEPVIKAGCIVAVEQEGEFKAVVHGTGKIALATSDIKQAIEFGEVIMIIVPAFGQVPIFEMALPHFREGQIIVSMPGNFAALAYAKLMKDKGITKPLFFADTDSIPYACRKLDGNQVLITGLKLTLHTGVYPGEATDKTIDKIQPLFTLKLTKMSNVIEPVIANMNMILHPPPVILNTGWIEITKGNFSFYQEGMSPSVCRIMDAEDKERMEMAAMLKMKAEPFILAFKSWYGDKPTNDTWEYIHQSEYHKYFPGPPSLDNRYINEDIAYILLPLRDLARKFKPDIKTPIIDGMLLFAEVMLARKIAAQRGFDLVAKDGETVDKLHERLSRWLM